jgi:hypothetical protein
VSLVGSQTQQWAEAMVNARGVEGTRVLQGLLALTKKHPCEALEKACEIALSHGCWRLRTIRQLVGRETTRQEPLPFLEEHPLIRPLEDYAAIVAQAFRRQADRPSVGEGLERHGGAMRLSGAQQKSPGDLLAQGPLAASPPRSDYPSPGCTSAEPGSVSPDSLDGNSSSSFHQEKTHE